jgi:hypothetical protein
LNIPFAFIVLQGSVHGLECMTRSLRSFDA